VALLYRSRFIVQYFWTNEVAIVIMELQELLIGDVLWYCQNSTLKTSTNDGSNQYNSGY